MAYYLETTVDLAFDDAIARTREALKAERFGVITEINIQDTLKNKIDIDFRRYTILGACNPSLAYEALQLEDKVGTLLPCNVVVQEVEPGRTGVAAIDPVASMQAIKNPKLQEAAEIVRCKLQDVIGGLAQSEAQRS